jgi:2-iminobutanoate/2-iminopropanoate deaminase
MARSILRVAVAIVMIVFVSGVKAQDIGRKVILTPDAPKPIGPYSQAIRRGQTLYLSGQIAIDPATNQFLSMARSRIRRDEYLTTSLPFLRQMV